MAGSLHAAHCSTHHRMFGVLVVTAHTTMSAQSLNDKSYVSPARTNQKVEVANELIFSNQGSGQAQFAVRVDNANDLHAAVQITSRLMAASVGHTLASAR